MLNNTAFPISQSEGKAQDSTPVTLPSDLISPVNISADPVDYVSFVLSNPQNIIRQPLKKPYVQKHKSYPRLKPRLDLKEDGLFQHEILGETSIIIAEEERKGEFRFHHWNSAHEFNKYRMKLQEQFFHEVILEGRDQRPYFDIDAENMSPEEGSILLTQVVNGIIKNNPKIKFNDIMIFSSHRHNKISYHIVVDRWKFPNNAQNLAFFLLVRAEVDPKYHINMDVLYKSKQNLRVYGSMKPDVRVKKIRDPQCQWVWLEGDLEPINENMIMGGSLVSNASAGQWMPHYYVEPKEIKGTPIAEGEIDLIIEIARAWFKKENVKFCYDFVCSQGAFIELRRHDGVSSHCLLCNRTHDRMSPYIMTQGENKDIYFNCRRILKKYLHLGRLYNKLIKCDTEYMPKCLYESVTQAFPEEKKVTTFKYDEKYCRPLNDDHKIQVIKSPTGTGKSKQMNDFLNRHVDLSFISLTARITFAIAINASYRKAALNCICYLDKVDLRDKNVVISAESLHNVKDVFDIVIIDEITSFLSQMNSKFHKNKLHENITTLELILKNAQYIICMDADISQSTFKLLEHVLPQEPIYYQINIFKNSQDLTVYKDVEMELMLEIISKYIQDGKNIQIVLGAESTGIYYIEPLLKQLGLIEGQLGEIGGKGGGYIFHHSKGTDYRSILNNVEDSWPRLRVVVYTSIVGAGIDCSTFHFHARFSFVNSMTTTVTQFNQMRSRVRHMIDHIEYMSFKIRAERLLTTHDAIQQRYEDNLNSSSKTASFVLQGYEKFKIRLRGYNSKSIIWKYEDIMWVWNAINDQKNINISKCWMYPFMLRTLRDAGVTIKDLQYKQPHELKAFWKKWAVDQRTQVKADLIRTYDYIDVELEDENDILKKIQEGNATAINKLAANKIRIVRKLINGISVSGEECVLYNDHSYQFNKAQMELEYSYMAMLVNDITMSQFTKTPNPELEKYMYVRWICKKLKVGSTLDRNTEIVSDTIRNKLKFYTKIHPRCKKIFGLQSNLTLDKKGIPELKLRGAVIMISTIFTGWSCSKLQPNKDKEWTKNSVPHYIYNLVETAPGFNKLYDRLKPKKKYGIDDIISIEEVKELPETIPVLGFKNGELVTIHRIKEESLVDQVESMVYGNKPQMTERKNDPIDMTSHPDYLKVKLSENDIRKYYKYEGFMTAQDYKNNEMLIFDPFTGTNQLNERGLEAKRKEDIIIQQKIDQGLLFRYNDPEDSTYDGVYIMGSKLEPHEIPIQSPPPPNEESFEVWEPYLN